MRPLGCLLLIFILSSGCGPRVGRPDPGDFSARDAKVRELLRHGTILLRADSPGSLQKAAALFSLALEILPEDPRALDGLGCVAIRSHSLLEARFYFQQAVKADPGYDRAYEHLAFLASTEGNAEEARRLFEKAISVNPLNYRARNNLAVLLKDQTASSGKVRLGQGWRSSVQLLKASGIVARSVPALAEELGLIDENLERFDVQE